MDATVERSIASIRDLLGRGECLAAFDAAVNAERLHPANTVEATEIAYLRALALARSGATSQARSLAAALVESAPWERLGSGLGEDIAALSARISKDEAWRTEPRGPALAASARAYEEVYRRFGRYYACVNAATLWLLAGDPARAARLARETLAIVDRELGEGEPGTYWDWATRGEALLVLGDIDAAGAALTAASRRARYDLGARASTRRQIRHLCDAIGLDPSPLVDLLAPPDVVHYCGHMASPAGAPGRFPAEQELTVIADVRDRFASRPVGFVHGSLASGADIIVAEIALERSAELHLVVPFDIDEFVAVSVAPGGPRWVERFTTCLDAATSLTIASDSAYSGDDVLFAYAARIAMGQALNRASGLDGRAWQLAIFDGDPRTQIGGTKHDMDVWQRAGGLTEVVRITSTIPPLTSAAVPADVENGTSSRREIRSVLFGDFKGFSRLRDEHVHAFLDTVMSPLAAVLDKYNAEIIVRNTWGDGLFVVLADAVSGARCALEIQERLGSIDLTAAGLPADMGMRLGGHTAPVIAVHDPVLDLPTVMGRELTRAARIEPRTPTGEVYVTAAFAALLALEPDCGVTPEYVGHLTTAKDFETTAMYLLRR